MKEQNPNSPEIEIKQRQLIQLATQLVEGNQPDENGRVRVSFEVKPQEFSSDTLNSIFPSPPKKMVVIVSEDVSEEREKPNVIIKILGQYPDVTQVVSLVLEEGESSRIYHHQVFNPEDLIPYTTPKPVTLTPPELIKVMTDFENALKSANSSSNSN